MEASPPTVPVGAADCLSCTRKAPGFACASFSPDLEAEWVRLSYGTFHPYGSSFVLQGQPARGVFLICHGSVKLRIDDPGASLIVRIARSGELLGLREMLLGSDYRFSADALEPCAVRFTPVAAFRELMSRYPELNESVLLQLAREGETADRLHAISMIDETSLRVGAFFLDLCRTRGRTTAGGVRFSLEISHREIGQVIGVSRETVTRKLGELRTRGLIRTKGMAFLVPDVEALDDYCRTPAHATKRTPAALRR